MRRMSDIKPEFVDYKLMQTLTVKPSVAGASPQEIMGLPVLQAYTDLHQSVFVEHKRTGPYYTEGHFLVIRMDQQIDPGLLMSNMNPDISSIMVNIPGSIASAERFASILMEYVTRSTGKTPCKDGKFIYILSFFKELDNISRKQLTSMVHAGYNNPHLRRHVQESSGNFEAFLLKDTNYGAIGRESILYNARDNGGQSSKTYGIVEVKTAPGREFDAQDFLEVTTRLCAAYRQSRFVENVNFSISQVEEAMHMIGTKIKVSTMCADQPAPKSGFTRPNQVYRFARNSKTRSFHGLHFLRAVEKYQIFGRPSLVYIDDGSLAYATQDANSVTSAGELCVVQQGLDVSLGKLAASKIASAIKSPEGIEIITSQDLWSRRVPTHVAPKLLSCTYVGHVFKSRLSKDGVLEFVNANKNNMITYYSSARYVSEVVTLSRHQYLNGRRDVLLNMTGKFSAPAKAYRIYLGAGGFIENA